MRVQVRKLQSVHDNLAKDTYIGTIDSIPKVGQCLSMCDEYLWTTPIIAIKRVSSTEYSFGTRNSLYYLTVLDDQSASPNKSKVS